MEKLPHQEFRDNLAQKLKQIRKSKTDNSREDAIKHRKEVKSKYSETYYGAQELHTYENKKVPATFQLEVDKDFLERGIRSGNLKRLNSKVLDVITSDPNWLDGNNIINIQKLSQEEQDTDNTGECHPLLANKNKGKVKAPNFDWVRTYEEFIKNPEEYSQDYVDEEIIRKGFTGHGHDLLYDLCNGSESGTIIQTELYKGIRENSPILYSIAYLPYELRKSLMGIFILRNKKSVQHPEKDLDLKLLEIIKLFINNVSKLSYILSRNPDLEISDLDNEMMIPKDFRNFYVDIHKELFYLEENFGRGKFEDKIPTEEDLKKADDLLNKAKLFFESVNKFLSDYINNLKSDI